jgi:hypothetical protein
MAADSKLELVVTVDADKSPSSSSSFIEPLDTPTGVC